MPLHVVLRVTLLCLIPWAAFASGAGGEEGSPLRDFGYQALNFILLIVVLILVARKPVREFFAGRHARIKGDLDEAAELLAAAESRHGEIQARTQELQGRLEELEAASRSRTEEESTRILAEAHRMADRIQSDAAAAIDQELLRARRELRAEAADLAVDLAREILEEQVGAGDRERLLDEFIERVDPGDQERSPTN
jgi:F-type H+-transporting ATPase subunit b